MSRTQETYFEKIAVKASGTQTGVKTSISSFFSHCMEKGIGDPLISMKKSEENCFDLFQGWYEYTIKRKSWVKDEKLFLLCLKITAKH